MNVIVDIGQALAGLAFIIWARHLSLKYNAWTTHLRERHSNINPPPTREWRTRNTTIMTVMFRIIGVLVLLISCLHLLTLISNTSH
jgi:hypothetical protein